ncbi:hypothetical protein EHS25_003976 [Saitozyma podzolica]|uniref:Uncharacterized protein n=1 Tax=Saitozyma podzolica TaxID=1890683 RepID=A0A427YSR1_9TREE|nr:hypothetical protein EHS25_003976 [Saitozyma podzolica]
MCFFKEDFEKAIDTPIDRYIPENRTREAVLERHIKFLSTDWEAEAYKAVEEYYTSQGRESDFLI